VLRLGLLSDLHCELDPQGSRWINPFEPERLDDRLDDALDWFAASEIDALVLLGDFVQAADPRSLHHAVARVASFTAAPVAAVAGNHDLRVDLPGVARQHGLRLLAEEPLELGGVVVAGVGLSRRGAEGPFYLGELAPVRGNELLVVASHFPLLSEAERLAGAGLPYPGDLVNREALLAEVTAASSPVVVLSGHIHARTAHIDGPVLQCTVGALIEPPFDCTLLELDPEGHGATRTARRLGPAGAVDPVFAPEGESWHWSTNAWRTVAERAPIE
jgi:hypothetical protein